MRPTQILSGEHRVMLAFLDTLGRLIELTVRQGRAPEEDLDAALSFLEEYGDRYHHAKEDQLFDRLRQVGMRHGERPVATLCREHRRGRELVQAMRDHVPDAARGDKHAVRALGHLAREFVDHELQHIEKEDRILFPLVDELITAEDEKELLEVFSRLEATLTPRLPAELEQLASDLNARYGHAPDGRPLRHLG